MLIWLSVGFLLLVGGGAWLLRKPAHPPATEGHVLPGGAVVAYSPGYRVSFFGIERFHPFDSFKYDRIAKRLVREELVPRDGFLVPQAAERQQLAAVHDPSYLDDLSDRQVVSEVLELNLPGIFGSRAIEQRILAPFQRATGGTVAAARAALEHGTGINLGGGFHHAKPEGGHGFCVYNDVAVALHVLRGEGFAGRVLIVDTDAHQGDGNHAAFAADPTVYSLSLQQEKIFPQPRVPGDRDVELASGTDDGRYLAILERELDAALTLAAPELLVHVAGSDVLNDDPLATLALTPEGLVRRDLLVARAAWSRGIPYLHLLAGGYGPSSAQAQAGSVAALLEELRRGAAGG